MKYTQNVSGEKIKEVVQRSGKTREKVAALTQDYLIDEGLSFSLAGLDKLYRGEFPKRAPGRVLEAVAKACDVSVSEFADPETISA